MSADRRRTLRAPCDLPVHWKRGKRDVLGRAKDLNADGLFLRTIETIELNYVLDLAITLPTGKISFTGVSRFIGATRYGQGIGVAIHVITKDDAKLWHDYYRSQMDLMIDALPRNIARHLVAR